MEFDIDFFKISDRKLMDMIQQLYFSAGYYKIKRGFPHSENPFNVLCTKYFKQVRGCPKCPFENITEKSEGKSLCFYIGHNPKEVIKKIPSLVKRIEMVANQRRLLTNYLV